MKIVKILIIIFLCQLHHINAQCCNKKKNSCQTIIIKKDNCCITKLPKVKTGDQICIRIEDFDIQNYDFEVISKDTFTKMEDIPGLFKSILTTPSKVVDGNASITINYYQSLPIFINDAVKAIYIKVSPHETNAKLPSYETNFYLNPGTKHYFGFSSGFFISDVRNIQYSTRTNYIKKDSFTYNIVTEESNKNEIGILSLVHSGYNLFDDVYAQIGMGPTLSLSSKLQFGFAIGGGLAIGKRQKLTINYGWHWSYVKRLSNAYDLSKTYLVSSDPYTVNRLIQGGFLSIGFNFLNF